MRRDSTASSTFRRSVGIALAVCLGGSVACVDTVKKAAMTCAAVTSVPYTGNAVIPSGEAPPPDPNSPPPYVWQNVVIKGGGFVSGIITSPVLKDLVFARTDVGGAYRYDPANRRWMPITDWLGHNDANLVGIESIAPDPVDPNRVYIAAGEYLTGGNGWILSSTDMGQTWTRNAIAAPMGGNADGRSMGERLVIDPNLPSTLYFGSRNAGLWMSTDSAQHWTQVASFPKNGATGDDGSTGYGLTFVAFDPRSGSPGSASQTMFVGVGVLNGTGLFGSTNGGMTWSAIAGQPTGMMPHHAVFDGCGNVYFAYNDGSGPNGPKNGSTATNLISSGAIWRYGMAGGDWTNVSPPPGAGGFGGISADVAHPGTMVITTIDRWSPDTIYRTTNGGASWTSMGGAAQRDVAGAQWLFWHGASPTATGWMGDIEIDPFNPSRALYITGQGLWSSDDVTAADAGSPTHWTFDDDGLEETVALDLASPRTGALLLTGVGDIAGFRHDDLTVSPPDGMFASPIFSNTSSLDFAEAAPDIVLRVGTNSAATGPRGATSTDGGTTWTSFATSPPNGTNANSSAAISADGSTIVWAASRATPSYSRDKGATWTASVCMLSTGAACTFGNGMQVSSDRVNPAKFYGSTRNRLYASSDGGATFTQLTAPSFGRTRPVFGIEGDVWMGTGSALLHSTDSAATFTAVGQVNAATAVGFGMAASGGYPAVYIAGSVGGVWGIYRSDDAGATWTRIDDPQHQFGFINVLTGDQRRYGRIYLGTAGRGIVYGDPR